MKGARQMKRTITAIMVAAFLTGCMSVEKKQEIKQAITTAIIEYAQKDGLTKACEYIDKLAAEGRIGPKNAEDLKAAIAKGVDHLVEKMEETEVVQ